MSDPKDLSHLKPLAFTIERTRCEQGVERVFMGGYLLGLAVGYMQAAGASSEEIRGALESALKDN